MSVKVLGVRIDAITRDEVLQRAVQFLSGGAVQTIFTPNPEMIMAAQKDDYFKGILNNGALNLCDGKGIAMVYRLKKHKKLERIAGVDFMRELCALGEKRGYRVYLLGTGVGEIIVKAARKLKEEFPNLNIVGYHPGPQIKNLPNKELSYLSNDNEEVLADIARARPDILFVGFGAGKQEKYIAENMDRFTGVKIAMGVGGSFEIISGKLKRAPKFLRTLGLEWLWRLIQEPRRAKRIWTAVIVFPLKFMFENYAFGKN